MKVSQAPLAPEETDDAAELATLTPGQKAQQLVPTAGNRADREIDAHELRERAWRRGNSGS